MHFLNILVLFAPAFALAAPKISPRAGEATLQSGLQSEIGSLRNRFDALCSETSSVLDSGASASFGSLAVSLQEANARTSELCSGILGVLSTVGNSVASAEETFADADEAVRGRLGG